MPHDWKELRPGRHQCAKCKLDRRVHEKGFEYSPPDDIFWRFCTEEPDCTNYQRDRLKEAWLSGR